MIVSKGKNRTSVKGYVNCFSLKNTSYPDLGREGRLGKGILKEYVMDKGV